MSSAESFVGIDLGTTNSVQAVLAGEHLHFVRAADGGVLTPSVVRIDGRGRLIVGSRARPYLEKDPENTRAEFKRLMGTGHVLGFPAAGVRKTPPELAAEVLKAMRQDFTEQFGYSAAQAVISVPALFELPQVSATSEAARLAGFTRVEFIQEPIASAIASGWSKDGATGSWLVYDLGGGTFDVSLLESREGLLRVVGHDGDNFLGGRDIDQGLADYVLGELAQSGHAVDVKDPRHAAALRRLRAACEIAKIELTRAPEVDLQIERLFQLAAGDVDVDLVIRRTTLETIVLPLIDRSLAICERLLAAHGLVAGQLERVVLVGGPTMIPAVRARLAGALSTEVAEGNDPMTLVAHGAALFAMSHAISSKPAEPRPASAAGASVWLQYPAVSSDLCPYVVGKVSDAGAGRDLRGVLLRRADGGFATSEQPLDAERAFAVPVELTARARSAFRLFGVTSDGREIPLEPPEFSIVHGVSIGDPPLSRTIGVALADNQVQIFFERGCPLPVRRSFTLRTVETVSPGNAGFALQVPIVQGEFPFAHLCRLVGTLEIAADAGRASVPGGSDIEVTLELDRGGRLLAAARVPVIDQNFQHVEHLVVPELGIDAMRATLADLLRRAAALRSDAFRGGDPRSVRALLDVEQRATESARSIELAEGGDLDASERARRQLVDLDATLSEVELQRSWPKLEEEAHFRLATATHWLGSYGTDVERDIFSRTAQAVTRALAAKNGIEVRRQLQVARSLGSVAYLRDPEAWPNELEHAANRLSDFSEPLKARALIEEGRRALDRGDKAGVERAVRGLWKLMPPDRAERMLGYGSGVR